MDTSKIESLFREYGWSCTAENDSVVTAQFALEKANLLVVTQWAEPWLRFSIPHLAPFGDAADSMAQAYENMLHLNLETRLVRFALSPQEQIGIYADVYAIDDDISFKEFEIALDALCYFAETAHNRLWEILHKDLGEDNTHVQ